MVEIIAALSGVKTGLDLVKAAREMLKRDKVDAPAITAHLSDVQDALYQAREALGDAQEEIRNLTNNIAELKRAADFGSEFTFEQGVYWRQGFPYCPTCWEANRRPVRLGGPNRIPGTNFAWICPDHNKSPYMIPWGFEPKGSPSGHGG